MALSKKKATQNEQTTSHSVTSPNVPSFISQPAENIAGGINSLIGQGASPFTPQINDVQRNAWEGAKNLTGPDYSASKGLINGVGDYKPGSVSADQVSGESLLSGLGNYYSPFKDQVLNPALTDYDVNSGKTRAAQAAAAAGNKSFQGSRYGIQEAQTEGELARGRAATEGGLLKDMYQTALTASESDAARRQAASVANAGNNLTASQANQLAQARADEFNRQQQLQKAQQLAGFEDSAGAAARANVGAQLEAGGNQMAAGSAVSQYPIEFLQKMGGLLQGLNPALFTGATTDSTGTGKSTTSESQSIGSWIGNFLTSAAANASKAAAAGA